MLMIFLCRNGSNTLRICRFGDHPDFYLKAIVAKNRIALDKAKLREKY